MPAYAILGAQWGDEGKGKLVDVLAPAYEYVVRFQGGNNAGHTVVVGKETFKFNLLPSGAVQGRKVVIGNGVVVDPRVLVKELENLEKRGRTAKLLISERAHVILPYHILLDGAAEEGKSGARKIGTTKRGIGPCYADKAARLGIRMWEFMDPVRFEKRLNEVYGIKAREMLLWDVSTIPTVKSILDEYNPLADQLRQYVTDTGLHLDGALRKKQRVLLEGAQGILLDVDHGMYPFVTSSSTVGTSAGAGLGTPSIEGVLGVAKAYATRVGEGPFPTEISAKHGVGKKILETGKEFGTVTGRERRIGWLDVPALRYAVRVGGLTHLALTKLDVLQGVSEVQVCIAYEQDGKRTDRIPASDEDVARLKPIYKTFKGWSETATGADGKWKLSKLAGAYVQAIEKLVGIPIVVASVGPARDATITLRPHPFGSTKGPRGNGKAGARRAGPRRSGPG